MPHRTALVTAALIAAVVLAGAAAAGASLGILNAADSGPVGELSASATEAQMTTPKVIDVYADDAKTTDSREYKIEKAGTVRVVATKNGVRLEDVTARAGWNWKLVQTAQKKLKVVFRSKSTTYEFVAVLRSNGKIGARVVRPVTKVVGGAGAAPAAAAPAHHTPKPVNPAPVSKHVDADDHADDHDDDEPEHHEGGHDDD